jgi:methionine aminotransferase
MAGPKISLISKLPDVGTTIFTVMSQLASDAGALNLSQGFPEFDAPQALRDALNHHVNSGQNQYAPMTGVSELREQVVNKISMQFGADLCPVREVTITHGATEALYVAIQAVVGEGDEVIVFDPAYDSYEPAVSLAGGRTVHLPLQEPDFSVDWDRVQKAINSNTRLIILNSPHNPTGAILDRADLDALAEIVRAHKIWIVSDEVYEHMTFDGEQHCSVLAHEELATRSFVISSFGKTLHATGWKIGYCAAPAKLMEEFRKIHQFVCFCIARPMQLAIADFLGGHPEHWQKLPEFYQAKRDLFCGQLQNSRFRFMPARGSYFQLLEYSQITQMSDVDYARALTLELGVASIPVSSLSAAPLTGRYLRFCFAKNDATLIEAANRLSGL